MCGIGGFMRQGTEPIDPESVKVLMIMLASRGQDAAGIVTMAGKKIAHLKAPKTPWEFTASKEWDEFLDRNLDDETEIVLLHSRKATVGDYADNRNNHPMEAGKARVIHNGFISNHETVFNRLKVPRSAECDSDAVRAVIDKFGLTEEGCRELSFLAGSAAIAAVHPDFPSTLYLGRSGGPVCIAYNEDLEHFMFASEKNMLYTAGRTFREVMKGRGGKGHGIWMYKPHKLLHGTMNANSSWLLTPTEGLIMHEELKIGFQNRNVDYSGVQHTRFAANRTQRLLEAATKADDDQDNDRGSEEDAIARANASSSSGVPFGPTLPRDEKWPEKVQCPNPQCKKVISLTPEQRKLELDDLQCTTCKTMLNAAIEVQTP